MGKMTTLVLVGVVGIISALLVLNDSSSPLQSWIMHLWSPTWVRDSLDGNNQLESQLLNDLDRLLDTNPPLGHLHDIQVWPVVRGIPRRQENVHLERLRDLDFTISSAFDDEHELRETIEMFQRDDSSATPKCGSPPPERTIDRFIIDRDAHHYDSQATIPTLENEKYILFLPLTSSTKNNTGVIRIRSRFALVHALATLGQFASTCHHANLPLLIVDQPAFAYRGILLDTAREFYSADSIKKMIRMLSWSKLNVLHWHFADDQSYGLASEVVPEITESTYPLDLNNTHTYSIADVKSIVDEGRRWGVRIVPELDMPAHAGGWHRVKGLLSHCPRFACQSAWGLTMHPYSQRTWEVIDLILKEIKRLFPDPLLHLGGDEVSEGCWLEDDSVRNVSTNRDVHWGAFEKRLRGVVASLGKQPIRWEDCRRFYQHIVPSKAQPVTFHLWQWWEEDLSWTVKEVSKGNRIISSMGWYLDNYCLSWDECYRRSPLHKLTQLTRQQLDDPDAILGLEACPWEMSERNLDSENLWMRFAAVGEQMWSSSEFTASSRTPFKRGSFLRVFGNRTLERLVGFCEFLAGSKRLFPSEMCSRAMLARREPIRNDPRYRARLREREEMICRRIATDPPIPCTAPHCVLKDDAKDDDDDPSTTVAVAR